MTRAGLLLGTLVLLAACDHGAAPAPVPVPPTLERPVVRIAAPRPGNTNVEIPRTALVERGGLPGVFVLDDAGHARFRLVRLGKTTGDRLEVISGLNPGEVLVRSDLAKVRDGSPIKTSNSTDSPSPASREKARGEGGN